MPPIAWPQLERRSIYKLIQCDVHTELDSYDQNKLHVYPQKNLYNQFVLCVFASLHFSHDNIGITKIQKQKMFVSWLLCYKPLIKGELIQRKQLLKVT